MTRSYERFCISGHDETTPLVRGGQNLQPVQALEMVGRTEQKSGATLDGVESGRGLNRIIRDFVVPLTPFIGGTIKVGHIVDNWPEILRLATSIKAGTTTASAILKSLPAYPRQNGLAVALRELGRLERTLFALEWMRSLELRKRTSASLARGEARNALAREITWTGALPA